ncbi:MAG: hypothetical protein GY708_02565 [Actinomycetia bacterium]|nr:hypothetical protein [Actinomycetes bacterium]MCP4961187.1 hypothetical protein [Actinomycetes bacterium]
MRDRRAGSGFSTLELSMTVAIMSMVLAAFYGAYNGFLRDVAFAEQLAEVERRSRPAINEMLIELRQATPPNGAANGQPIEVLTEDRITFYSDRASADGPERITYEKVNCADGLCELQKSIIFATAGSEYPNWVHDIAGGPDVTLTVLPRIPADVVLFVGKQINGGTVVDVAFCDRFDELGLGVVSCPLDNVLVEIEVVPRAADTSIVPRNYEVIEEVQLRNADF